MDLVIDTPTPVTLSIEHTRTSPARAGRVALVRGRAERWRPRACRSPAPPAGFRIQGRPAAPLPIQFQHPPARRPQDPASRLPLRPPVPAPLGVALRGAGMGHAPHATAWGGGWWPRPRPCPQRFGIPKILIKDSGRALPPRVHTFGNDRIAAASSVRSCRPEARSRHVERRRGARSRAFVLLLSTAGGPTVRRCRWRG